MYKLSFSYTEKHTTESKPDIDIDTDTFTHYLAYIHIYKQKWIDIACTHKQLLGIVLCAIASHTHTQLQIFIAGSLTQHGNPIRQYVGPLIQIIVHCMFPLFLHRLFVSIRVRVMKMSTNGVSLITSFSAIDSFSHFISS